MRSSGDQKPQQPSTAPGAWTVWLPAALASMSVAWGGNQFTPLLGPYETLRGLEQITVNMLLCVSPGCRGQTVPASPEADNGRGQVDRPYAGPARSISTPTLALADFGRTQGWQHPTHLRTLGDLNADDVTDVVAFGEAGVYASVGGATLATPTTLTPSFGAVAGWGSTQNQRLLGDVNGDKREDIVGFGYSGVYVQLS